MWFWREQCVLLKLHESISVPDPDVSIRQSNTTVCCLHCVQQLQQMATLLSPHYATAYCSGNIAGGASVSVSSVIAVVELTVASDHRHWLSWVILDYTRLRSGLAFCNLAHRSYSFHFLLRVITSHSVLQLGFRCQHVGLGTCLFSQPLLHQYNPQHQLISANFTSNPGSASQCSFMWKPSGLRDKSWLRVCVCVSVSTAGSAF